MSRDFWSRRREAVAQEAEADAQALERADFEKDQAELDAMSDEDILAQYNLPEPDTLETSDAVKDFLSHDLPQRLKTRALRKLWRLNPILANVDGLVDYGEDYTDAATVIEGMQTAYQVGKGMLAHLEAQAQEAEPISENDTQEPQDDLGDDAMEVEEQQSLTEEDLPEEDPAPEAVHAFAEDSHEDDIPAPPSRNRRMTFQFESVT